MDKSIEWYQDLADDLYDNPDSAKKRDEWDSIQRLRDVDVILPESVRDKYPDAKFASSLPRDILEGVKTFLSSRAPLIRVMPMRHDRDAKEHASIQETTYDWHFGLANRRGKVPFMMEATSDAVWSSRICFRTEYLPWEAKRKKGGKKLYSPEMLKDMRRFGDMRFVRYDPRSVYEETGGSGLRFVVETSVMTYRDLLNEYGELPQIKKAISKLNDKDPATLRSNYVSLRSIYDLDKRVIFFTPNGSTDTFQTGGEERYVIMDTEHGLPFIPWVIQDFEEPLALGVVRSGAVDKLATTDLIQFSEWIRVASRRRKITTPNPNNPDLTIDEEGNDVMGTQTRIDEPEPIPVDPQWMVIRNILEQQVRFSLKGESLSNISSLLNGKNPYSGINLAQSTAISQLSPVISLVERALSEGVHQICKWIKHSGEPLVGYRSQRINETPSGDIGARKMVAPFTGQSDLELKNGLKEGVAYIDPSTVMINVTLQPNNIQDEQAQWNLAIIKQQAGTTQKFALETLVPEPEEMMKEKIEEQFTLADVARRIKNEDALNDVQIKITQMMVQAQAKIDSMMQQAQAQMQPQQGQPQPGGLPPSPETQMRQMNGGAQFQSMQGTTPRAGGPTAAQTAPRETRNTLNGTTDGGDQLT